VGEKGREVVHHAGGAVSPRYLKAHAEKEGTRNILQVKSGPCCAKNVMLRIAQARGMFVPAGEVWQLQWCVEEIWQTRPAERVVKVNVFAARRYRAGARRESASASGMSASAMNARPVTVAT